MTTTKQQETAPTLKRNQPCRSAQPKRQPLFGRGGLGERRFSQRSGLSPRISTPKSLREGARGRGFSQRSRLPRKFRMSPISSYSSGEGGWGRGASLREAASPPESPYPTSFIRCRRWFPSFCGRRGEVAAEPPQVSVSCLSGTRRWLSDCPRHPFGSLTFELVSYLTLAGRGGSVSRRDHNQTYRRRVHAAWAHKTEGKTKPIPSYSSGEGVWGRGASLREAASPPESLHPISFREGARGRVLFYQKSTLPRIFYSFLLIKRHTGAFGGHELFFGVGENAVIG